MLPATLPTGDATGNMALGIARPGPKAVLAALTALASRSNDLAEKWGWCDDGRSVPAVLSRAPLEYEDYLNAISKYDSWQAAVRREEDSYSPRAAYIPGDGPALRLFLDIFKRGRHKPNIQGWIQYLADVGFPIDQALSATFPLPEWQRRTHTLIAGSTGSGKSELMKALVFHYLGVSRTSVVVLDPHGDLVQQIAGWREFQGEAADRLVYLDYAGEEGRWPVLNPLDVPHLTTAQRAIYSRALTEIIRDALPDGGDFSPNMVTLTDFCFRVLLERPGSTLADVIRFVDDDRNSDLVNAGRRHSSPIIAEYFSHRFSSKSLDGAKNGISNRMVYLLGMDALHHVTCSKSTVDLASLCDAGNFILVNLKSLGRSAGDTFGKMLVAQLFVHTDRRQPEAGDTPIHLFIDEAERLFTKTFLKTLQEARKRGLHLTFAQQIAGRGFDGDDRDSLMFNTAIKLQGVGDCPGRMLQALGLSQEELRQLFPEGDAPRNGIFACKWGPNAETVQLTVTRELADNRVPPGALAALLDRQRTAWCTAEAAPEAAPAPSKFLPF